MALPAPLPVSLEDKYTLERGRVYLTGIQALVRLPLIDRDELEEIIVNAWRCQAPRALVAAWEKGEG